MVEMESLSELRSDKWEGFQHVRSQASYPWRYTMGSMLTVLLLRECHGVCLYKPAWGRSATHHMTSFCFFDFPLIVCV